MYIDSFIQKISLDTIIGLVSLLVGLIGLYLGAKANIRIKTINKKSLSDNAQDRSQTYNGNVTINHSSPQELLPLVQGSFQTAFNQAIERMDDRYKDNLNSILTEALKIIDERKLELSNYTKIDWINVYLENAKLVSDYYMQKVWAKVLAAEMVRPDSISFATIDVLKNLRQNDFMLFEKLATNRCDNYISNEQDILPILWNECLELEELRLLSLSATSSILDISNEKPCLIDASNEYVIVVTNNEPESKKFSRAFYMLTNSAMELITIFNIVPPIDVLKKYVDYWRSTNKGLEIKLHKVLSRNGNNVQYYIKEIY